MWGTRSRPNDSASAVRVPGPYTPVRLVGPLMCPPARRASSSVHCRCSGAHALDGSSQTPRGARPRWVIADPTGRTPSMGHRGPGGAHALDGSSRTRRGARPRWFIADPAGRTPSLGHRGPGGALALVGSSRARRGARPRWVITDPAGRMPSIGHRGPGGAQVVSLTRPAHSVHKPSHTEVGSPHRILCCFFTYMSWLEGIFPDYMLITTYNLTS